MIESTSRAWFVIQAKDSTYADIEGKAYEYPRHIPHAQRIANGDFMVVATPTESLSDGRRIVGIGHVEAIAGLGLDRLVATYDRYIRLARPATFDEIEGDPRKNRINSINPINASIV